MANIYELLDLGIDPRPEFKNIDEVKTAIEARKRKLSQGARGAKQAINEQKIKDLQAIAADLTMEKMDTEYAKAKENVRKNIENSLKYVVVNGKITDSQAEKIAKDNKVTIQFILREFLDIKIDKKETKKLEVPKCKDKMSKQVESQLMILKKENLYEFLNYHGTKDSLSTLRLKAPKELQDIAKGLAGEFDKNPNLDVKSAGTKLAALCQEVFANQQSKDDYNYYLTTYAPIVAILNRVGALAENNTLLPQAGEVLVAELNKIVRNVEESRRYLRGKCEDLKVNWTEVADNTIANCVFCGETIGVSDEVCGHCGKKQYIICKKCKKKSKADSEYCTSCGEKFGNVKKVAEYCAAAFNEIKELNFNLAKYFITQAEAEGAETEDIENARKLLQKTEKEVGEKVLQLQKSKDKKAYYEAKQILTDIKKMYPGYKNESLETVIQSALTRAKALFEQANKAAKENECLDLCDQIDSICSDYPGVSDLKDKFPPETPVNIVIKVDNQRKVNDILWEYKGVSSGIAFVVVRKEYAKPVTPTDGEVIGRFSARSCTDRKIEAGREYYYAVFACRGNKTSKPGYAPEMTVNLFDIENVVVSPGDGVIQFQWTNCTNGNVRIWRKENGIPSGVGDGTEVSNITSTGVWDNEVTNGKTYGYYLCTEYKVGAKILYSVGIKVKGTPEVPPQVVTYLLSEISETNKQMFRLEWDDDISDTIKFYGSPKPLEWEEGATVDRNQLEAKATLLNVTGNESGKGIVNIGNAEELYITAVTLGKTSCAIGASTYVSNRQIFKVTQTRLVHGDLHIFIDNWPKECDIMKVVWCSNSYPKSVNDKSAESCMCRKGVFNQTQTIVIKNALQQDYYISIYGKLGGDRGYAPAVNTVFSNKAKMEISYKLVVKKGFLGKINDVSLVFTGNEEFVLPELCIYKNAGFLPPNTSVGEKIKELAVSEEAKKSHTISLGKDFSKNEYIRAFLKNSQDLALFELSAISALNI